MVRLVSSAGGEEDGRAKSKRASELLDCGVVTANRRIVIADGLDCPRRNRIKPCSDGSLNLEPNFGLARRGLGLTYLLKKTCGNALQELRLANEYMPGPRQLAHLGNAYAVCGQASKARRILREFLNEPPRAIPAFAIAEIYMGPGDKDRAFRWFERAVDERDLSMSLRWDPRFVSLRSDPRFDAPLRRMKLA